MTTTQPASEDIVQYVVLRRDITNKWPLVNVATLSCNVSQSAIFSFFDIEDPYCTPKIAASTRKVTLEVEGEVELQKLATKLDACGIMHKVWNLEALATKPYPKNMVSQHFQELLPSDDIIGKEQREKKKQRLGKEDTVYLEEKLLNPNWKTPEPTEVVSKAMEFLEWFRRRKQDKDKELQSPADAKYVKVEHRAKNEMVEKLKILKASLKNGEEIHFVNSSTANTSFDPNVMRTVLHRKKFNPQKHTRRAIGRVVDITYDLCSNDSFRTLRHVYYRASGLFLDQAKSNAAIQNVCLILDCDRPSLNVFASCRGNVIGQLTYKLDDRLIDCNQEQLIDQGDGQATVLRFGIIIPPFMSRVKNIESTALFILVVESDACFEVLAFANFHTKYRCIILTGKGNPDHVTRAFLSKLQVDLSIPAFFLADADLGGVNMYSLYKFGSKNMAFDNKALISPFLFWVGILPSELNKLGIPTERLSLAEYTEIQNKLQDGSYQCNVVTEELMQMSFNDQKGNIESLESFGINGLTCHYLPYKLYKVMDELMSDMGEW